MKKNYIQIRVYRKNKEDFVGCSAFLLSDNVTGWQECPGNIVKLYFRDANPFAFATLYMNYDQFMQLVTKKIEAVEATREQSSFLYTVFSA